MLLLRVESNASWVHRKDLENSQSDNVGQSKAWVNIVNVRVGYQDDELRSASCVACNSPHTLASAVGRASLDGHSNPG